MGKKIGRNAPCPCGSGSKFKKCHGRANPSLRKEDLRLFDQARQQIEAREIQRKQQQGLGRPIISTECMDKRAVAVGGKLFFIPKQNSFHDFLREYLRYALGDDWVSAELEKSHEDKHPILQWYDIMVAFHEGFWKEGAGKVQSAPMIGAASAFMHLAYNLYLLAHNLELQKRLVDRLKNTDQFQGAYYETYVFGSLIKAGFTLEMEDECDPNSKHCECVAVYEKSGKKYSIEAKARGVEGILGKDENQGAAPDGEVKVLNKLRDALGKDSDVERIVFIDTNVPDNQEGLEWEPWMYKVLGDIRKSEKRMQVWGNEAPPAYVFITNYPYHHQPNRDDYRVSVMAEGFKIPDFKMGGEYAGLRAALVARENHRDMYDLLECMKSNEIPATFDGELPEFAFNMTDTPRLIIGQKYLVPNGDGNEEPGILESATVLENDKLVWGSYQLESGGRVLCSCPINDVELEAYKRSPETFFGVVHSTVKKADGIVDLYDFFYETAKGMTREQLLQQLKGHPRFVELEKLDREPLAVEYSLIFAESAHAQSKQPKSQ